MERKLRNLRIWDGEKSEEEERRSEEGWGRRKESGGRIGGKKIKKEMDKGGIRNEKCGMERGK